MNLNMPTTRSALSWLSIVLKLLLAADIILRIISFLISWGKYDSIEIGFSQNALWALATTEITLLIATVLIFLTWSYKSNCFARILGAKGLRFSPAGSIGWYFIPVANLVMPYLAMKEIWAATSNPGNWRTVIPADIISRWWVLWLLSNILYLNYLKHALAAKSTETIRFAAQLAYAERKRRTVIDAGNTRA